MLQRASQSVQHTPRAQVISTASVSRDSEKQSVPSGDGNTTTRVVLEDRGDVCAFDVSNYIPHTRDRGLQNAV